MPSQLAGLFQGIELTAAPEVAAAASSWLEVWQPVSRSGYKKISKAAFFTIPGISEFVLGLLVRSRINHGIPGLHAQTRAHTVNDDIGNGS